MQSYRKIELIVYRFIDWISASIAWLLVFAYRKRLEQPDVTWHEIFTDERLHTGILIIPLGWLVLYSVFDKYQDHLQVFQIGHLTKNVCTIIGRLFSIVLYSNAG